MPEENQVVQRISLTSVRFFRLHLPYGARISPDPRYNDYLGSQFEMLRADEYCTSETAA